MKELYKTHIVPWKTEKTEEMYQLLGQLTSEFPKQNDRFPKKWEFALLKYVLYTTAHAAKINDRELIEQTLAFWDQIHTNIQNTFTYQGNKWLLLDAQDCPTHTGLSERYNTTFRLFTKEAIEHGFEQFDTEYLTVAWKTIEQANSLSLINESGNIIVHQKKVDKPFNLTAYTNLLQGVIYTDWTTDPLNYAESVVHESAHSLLNYYIQVLQIKVDKTLYWSPWRQTKRPAFGILHGAWAFAHVYHFYDQLSKQAISPSVTQEMLNEHKERCFFEQTQMKAVHHSLNKILASIDHPVLYDLFQKLDPQAELFELQ